MNIEQTIEHKKLFSNKDFQLIWIAGNVILVFGFHQGLLDLRFLH